MVLSLCPTRRGDLRTVGRGEEVGFGRLYISTDPARLSVDLEQEAASMLREKGVVQNRQ